MKAKSSDNGAQKILDVLKKNSTILYPNLIGPTPCTYAQDAACIHNTLEEKHLSWADFPILSFMRASLNFSWGRLVLKENEEKKDIAFYGCSQNVGTTFLSFHMAAFVALSEGLKTIYIDTACDKGPTDSHPIGSTDLQGLLSYYFDAAPLDDCIYKTMIPNFYVLPAGTKAVGQQANRFPPTKKIKELVEGIHKHFDVAIYDCQPVLLKPIEISYAQQVKNIVLVSRYAASRREVCNQTIEAFKSNDLEITGVILNQREYPIPMQIYNLLK
jgi:Mrp family chromosome partitioning ATPase